MKLKRLLSLILILSIFATNFSSAVQISAQTDEKSSSQTSQVAAAKGSNVQTSERPAETTEEFVIKSKYDFSKFATRSKYCESNVKVTLACNIDMKGTAIKPIKEFSGVFDGCEYTINNLKIEDNSIGGKNSEFSFIKTLSQFAEIKNVTFDNYIIEGKPNISKVASLIVTNHGTISGVDILNGGINGIDKKTKSAGFVLNNAEDGVIENCFVGNMSAKDSNIRSGFIGTNHGKITKSSTTLSVKSKDLAGGFVSENFGIIEECSFNGNVESKKIAGGFCGKNSGEIVSCKAEGSIKASAKKGATICGGFVGENSGIINDCSSTGKVEGQEYVGGFVGINNDKGEISSCKVTCDVKSHTYVASIYCGGFVGLDAGKIEDCCFDGKVGGCVDSEKVLGIGLGITAGVIAIIAIACFFVKRHYNIKYNEDFIPSENALKDFYKGTELTTLIENDVKNNKESLFSYPSDRILDIEQKNSHRKNNIEMAADSFVSNHQSELNVNESTLARWSKLKYNDINKINNQIKNNVKNIYIEYCNEYAFCYDHQTTCTYDHTMNQSIIDNVSDYIDIMMDDAEEVYESAINNLNNNFIISLTALLFVGVTASSVIIGLTPGHNCANVAGFCGVNLGEIIKCSASNSSVKAKSMHNKYNMCGGFVGTNSETGTIKNCNATGNEIHNKTYTGGHLGGFVGENTGKIENGTTTVSVADGKCTGGFCGSNSGEISVSKSEGCAAANATTVKTKCGGFVGNNDEKGKIDGCTSIGSATGQEYVGGFAGINKSEISACNATVKATAKTKTNAACAGGFVGENEKGTIISCTATGGAHSQSSSGQAKAGGFVGANRANITNSRASGNVYLSAGTLHKDDGCGGFVGRNDQGGSIDGCCAECIVETTNKKKGGGFVGEAVINSSIINSKCKTKIITKSGIKDNKKFCQDKDKKALIENCIAD